jgi:protein involved in polysaccharide export with SLBB domain
MQFCREVLILLAEKWLYWIGKRTGMNTTGFAFRVLFGVLLAMGLLGFVLGGPAAAQQSGLPGPTLGTPAAAPPPAEASAPAPAPMPSSVPVFIDENYRLGTGDKVKVTVYGEDDLSGEFFVDGSGQIQLPLVGQVKAAGLTIHEFVAEVQTQLGAKYLRDPKVSAQIENYRPFYIIGEVNKPGEYPFENGLNALGAVALAGGYTYRADDADVYIRRSGSTKEQAFPANAATRIYPGDIVRVGERMF